MDPGLQRAGERLDAGPSLSADITGALPGQAGFADQGAPVPDQGTSPESDQPAGRALGQREPVTRESAPGDPAPRELDRNGTDDRGPGRVELDTPPDLAAEAATLLDDRYAAPRLKSPPPGGHPTSPPGGRRTPTAGPPTTPAAPTSAPPTPASPKSGPSKSAPSKSAPSKSAPSRSAPQRSAPPRSAPARSAGPTSAPPTSAPPAPAPAQKPQTFESLLAQSPTASTPPPPSYSALVGGAVPGDPLSTYSALLGQRLRAMLPWQGSDDPITQLIRTHRAIHPSGEASQLRHAYTIAEQMHRGQMRKSGEPFITHPLAVAQILADLGMDTTTLVAALLHDTVEDTNYTLAALGRDFGEEVALLVDGVTKFDKMFYGADAEVETIRKMIIAAGRDVRVLVIKLADRLHNMRTLDARSNSSQRRIATATREVLIPLCDRLGIQALKRELEDWVLRALQPSGFALITEYVRQRRGWNEYLHKVIDQLETELDRFKIDATITPRPRHLYSIWKDTVAGDYAVPHDPPRVVIIVDGPDTDCYAALGAVHGKWRPIPGRFKDFIASPKNNLYRSLHTTVTGPDDQTLEVLIRTEAMHKAAEFGIVANYRYPEEAAAYDPASQAEQLDWLRRMLDWQGAAADPTQFIDSLRCDLSEERIMVFTSTGRPVLLPSDATPVDLAFTLGADVGNRCIGARLNGRLIPLSSVLADGDTVEIITRPGQRDEFDFDETSTAPGPSAEWLQFVRTPDARLHISRWFEDHETETPPVTVANKVRLGRLAVGLALRQQGRGLASDLPLVRLAPLLGYPDVETLLLGIADHKITAEAVVAELIALVDKSPG